MTKQTYKISRDSWEVLKRMGVIMDKTLAGENQSRNEDGTYSVELDDSFVTKLKAGGQWKIGETLDAFIKRRANAFRG